MRSPLFLVAVALLLPLLVTAPSEAEAQCWHCDGLSCIDSDDHWGADAPCNYSEICYGGDCWWDCFPNGEVCNMEPEAVNMSGQVVVPPGIVDNQSALADLTELAGQRGIYRARCKGILVVMDDVARPTGLDRNLAQIELR